VAINAPTLRAGGGVDGYTTKPVSADDPDRG
jgi:hypothetical protein